MNSTLKWLMVPFLLVLLIGAGLVAADWGEREEHEGRGFVSRWFEPERMAYNVEEAGLYKEECGGCHFPFQPGFLPAASWQNLMAGLDDHFGENAELSDEKRQRILAFLTANAAGSVNREIPNKVMWSTRYTPNSMRITETAFFQHEHREIPPRVLENNGEKISFANCDSCHTRALQGSYSEHEIRIPGIGRWDD
jgi:hypothetical protein